MNFNAKSGKGSTPFPQSEEYVYWPHGMLYRLPPDQEVQLAKYHLFPVK